MTNETLEITIREGMDCPDCDGLGSVRGSDRDDPPQVFECRRCRGWGWVYADGKSPPADGERGSNENF
jgi:DnaJ-class molecular chaperone